MKKTLGCDSGEPSPINTEEKKIADLDTESETDAQISIKTSQTENFIFLRIKKTPLHDH